MPDTSCWLQIRGLASDFDAADRMLLVMRRLIFLAWSTPVLTLDLIQNTLSLLCMRRMVSATD